MGKVITKAILFGKVAPPRGIAGSFTAGNVVEQV